MRAAFLIRVRADLLSHQSFRVMVEDNSLKSLKQILRSSSLSSGNRS